MTPDEFKRARLVLKLSQPDAARLLGYGAATRVSEIEAGRRAPGTAVVLLLRAYLAGYRPSDWPVPALDQTRTASGRLVPVGVTSLPVSDEALRKVAGAMRRGIRRPGDIARQTGLGLLTVKEAVAKVPQLPRSSMTVTVVSDPKRRRRRGGSAAPSAEGP